MKINGNLTFHTLGDGEIRNAVIERVTGTLPATTVPGRIVYRTDDNTYYYHNGSTWVSFAAAGEGALQQEVDNIEAASGFIFRETDGTFDSSVFSGFQNIATPTSLLNALSQLDAAIEGIDTLAELGDTLISNGGDPLTNSFLYYDTTGNRWEDHVLVLDDVTDVTVSATEVNYLTGLTHNVASEFGAIRTFIGKGAAGAETPTYTATNYVTNGSSLEAAIGDLDAALAVVEGNLGATTLGGLSDVADTETGTLVIGDTYALTATSTTAYEVAPLTLGSLNNVADGIDTAALTEDILAYDGTQWTAVTPGTFAAEIQLGDLANVTSTTPTAGHVLYFTGTEWVNGATGATSGVQGYDADLAALAALSGTGIVTRTAADTYALRNIVESSSAALTVTNADGVAGNPTINVDATLDGLANLAPSAADQMIYATGVDTFAYTTITTFARQTLATAADAASARAGLDVYSIGEADTNFVDAAGDTMSGNLTMTGGATVTGVPDPVNATDAANKAYVDATAQGLSVKASVRAATTADLGGTYDNGTAGIGSTITIPAGTLNIDGVTDWAEFDGILVKDQTNAAENGRYYVSQVSAGSPAVDWILTRCTTCDTPEELAGAYVFVQEGLTYEATAWVAQVKDTGSPLGQIDIGIDDVNWIQFASAGEYQAGTGLSLNGTIFNVNLGAGITELPTDEVGVHVRSDGGLFTTEDGTTPSTATGAALAVKLANDTLVTTSNGLRLADLPQNNVLIGDATGKPTPVAITGDFTISGGTVSLANNVVGLAELANPGIANFILGDASGAAQYVTMTGDVTMDSTGATTITAGAVDNAALVNDSITVTDGVTPSDVALGGTLTFSAGTGLSVSQLGGTVTYAGVDATTATKGIASFSSADFAVSNGVVTIGTGAVGNTQLTNSSITMAGDTGTDAVALGETLTFTGGANVSTTVTANTVTIDVAAATSDLTNVTAAATEDGQVMVAAANGDYTPRQVQYIHSQTVAATSWVVTHNLGQKYCNVTVVDGNDDVIIAQNIRFDTSSQLTVTFNTAITGKVVVMGVAGVV